MEKIDKSSEKYIWKTEDIFKTEEDFYAAIEKAKEISDELVSYKGKLSTATAIYEYISILEKLCEVQTKISTYSYLKHCVNTADALNLKRFKFVGDVQREIRIKTSFYTPEILKLSEEEIDKLIEEEPRLERYKMQVNRWKNLKKHVLSEEKEELLATILPYLDAPSEIYDVLTDADFTFPSVGKKNGETLELTHATYINLLEKKDVEIRKQAFNNLYSVYKQYINTIAEMYTRDVKATVTLAKIRKHASSLESALENEYSTLSVYNSLISGVNKHLDFNHRYLEFKKEKLGLEEMHMYDLFVDITDKPEEEIPYEEAQKLVLSALSVLGEEYCSILSKAFNERWIHVYEQKAKRSGAFSLGVYGVHPYVLLNQTDNLESASTIAHELGHAMHSYYSSNAQNIINSSYTILVAEVASTVNEILFAEYMINSTEDKVKKASLINSQINMIRSTLIRQTMFAEFEQIMHSEIGKGNQLAADDINSIYYELNSRYMGKNIISDEEIKYEWARIPHFYRAFYVYKYSTGIASAIAIVRNILSGKEGYVERYIEMLKMGGSVKPLDQLRFVDVDLETDKPVEDAFAYLEEKLNQLEELMK